MERPAIGGSQKSTVRSSLGPPDEFEFMFNRTGATSVVGDVVQADIGATQAETTAATGGVEDAAGPFKNAILVPVATGAAKEIAPLGIVMEAVADNALMKVQSKGWVPVMNVTNVGAAGAAIGSALLIQATTGTAGKLDTNAAAANLKYVGWITSAHTAAAGAEALSGWFDGTVMRK